MFKEFPPSLKAFKQQFKCLTQQRSVVLRAPIPGNKAVPRFILENLPAADQTRTVVNIGGGCHPAGLHVPSQTKHNRRRQEVPRLGRSGPQKPKPKTDERVFLCTFTWRRRVGPESMRTDQKDGESCCYMHANRRKVIFRIRWMMLNSWFHNSMIAVIQMQIL